MSDEREPLEPGWWRLSVLGWLVHVALGAGLFARAAANGAYWDRVFTEYALALPYLTSVVHSAAAGLARPSGPWVMGGLAVFDLVMLLSLAAYARPVWRWWFWGVALALMLSVPLVEYAYMIPARKLLAAGLPLP
jgi:hypothetical protein